MSRDLSTGVGTAIETTDIGVFFAIDLDFSSGPLYLWTGLGDKLINGNTYIGTGNLLQISAVEETSDIAARGANMVLSGVPNEVLSLALTEAYQGRVCTIYFGVLNDTSDYTEIFSGYMDQMNIEEGSDFSTVTLQVENKLIDLERVRVSRYTSAYQKSLYPNDKGLDFVEDLQDKPVLWGRSE